MSNQQPMKQKCKPTVALKPLMWTAMKPHKIANSIWKSIDDSEVDLDICQVETLFKAKKKVMQNVNKSEEKKKDEKVSLISDKRRQLIEIVLARLKTSYSILQMGLLECDTKIIT